MEDEHEKLKRLERELKEVKDEMLRGLLLMKAARRTSHPTARAIFAGEEFNEGVIKQFERICGWNQEYDEAATLLAQALEKSMGGGTITEQLDRFVTLRKTTKRVFKAASIAAVLVAAGVTGVKLFQHFRNKKNDG